MDKWQEMYYQESIKPQFFIWNYFQSRRWTFLIKVFLAKKSQCSKILSMRLWNEWKENILLSKNYSDFNHLLRRFWAESRIVEFFIYEMQLREAHSYRSLQPRADHEHKQMLK